jgi:fructokinase
MIAVVGEALIDLVVSPGGEVVAHPGGGPYNAARTLARLGLPAAFLGRLAGDGFGRLLHGRLTAEGVALGLPGPSARPSTLAVATLDEAGVAGYAFYLDGTAAAGVSEQELRAALPQPLTAVHVGTLGLLMEPIGAATERLVTAGLPGDPLVFLDPNCRPGAVPDAAAYRARLGRIARHADIVKASTEDLAYLYPQTAAEAAAGALLDDGARLVLVTDGPRPARAFLSGAGLSGAGLPGAGLPGAGLPGAGLSGAGQHGAVLTAEAPAVTVADTIGAGDAFGGGFLGWWTANGLGRADLVRPELVGRALSAAAAVAALTCERPGANPPDLAEVQARGWWPDR